MVAFNFLKIFKYFLPVHINVFLYLICRTKIKKLFCLVGKAFLILIHIPLYCKLSHSKIPYLLESSEHCHKAVLAYTFLSNRDYFMQVESWAIHHPIDNVNCHSKEGEERATIPFWATKTESLQTFLRLVFFRYKDRALLKNTEVRDQAVLCFSENLRLFASFCGSGRN